MISYLMGVLEDHTMEEEEIPVFCTFLALVLVLAGVWLLTLELVAILIPKTDGTITIFIN